MINLVGPTDNVETHSPRIGGVAFPGLLGERNVAICENGLHLIGHGFKHTLKQLPGCLSLGYCNEISDGVLVRSVYAQKKIALAFSRLHLSNVDPKEPDGLALKLLPCGPVALDIR
jgi:hypothetical protein